nr:response regulator [Desulfobacterales bacterium]
MKRKRRVLVVDNHPVILTLMSNLLEKHDYSVRTAADGLSALDMLRKKTYIPDVIFIDLVMPNIDGVKLSKTIRMMPEFKHVHIVILSAVAVEEKIRLDEIGASACIAKEPFNKMSQNILSVLAQLENNPPPHLLENVFGRENVYSRQITKELLSSKKHYEAILNNMSEGILEITPESRIVYANPTALSLIDISEEKLLSTPFTDFFHGDDRKRFERILNGIETDPYVIPEDSPITLNSKHVSMNIIPIIQDSQKTIIVIIKDVTYRKRMEAQLAQARKMEAIGTLAGGIAHDFNNLLMGIQGNVSLMLLNIGDTHPYYERLKNIEKLVQSGSKLTGQLLAYARKGRYEVRPINLNDLIEKTSETFARTRREVSIRKDLARDLFVIEADQAQIEQVLLNLYVNAWQAMPGGGEIFIKTINTTHENMKSKVYDPKPGNYVLLRVTDTGEGMDEATWKRIFDPFFTTKGMGKGTGLGLASVYGIIKGHSGYIDVESEKGKGTTFLIYLPASKKEASSTPETRCSLVNGTRTILLVDDEESILKVGQELLEVLGYRVLTASGGEEAVRIYRQNQDIIDIVILDIVMPDMRGGEAYDRLKGIKPQVKVLLSSGYSINGEATEILKRGCNGFIQKPFKIEELSQSIKKILT